MHCASIRKGGVSARTHVTVGKTQSQSEKRQQRKWRSRKIIHDAGPKSNNTIGNDLGTYVFTNSQGNNERTAHEPEYPCRRDPGEHVIVLGRERIPNRKPVGKRCGLIGTEVGTLGIRYPGSSKSSDFQSKRDGTCGSW